MLIPRYSGYTPDGRRLYYKGGKGDPGADARQQEGERQARIAAATESINSIFNGSNRDALYDEQKKTVYDLNSKEVERQAQEAERTNRFGLARTGLAGGSVDVDSVADINRRTNEGLLRAGGIADQSAADVRRADESTRSNLISMAQSGIDTGSASTMALNGLKVNADNVAAQRSGASVGSLFNDMSQAYLLNQQRQGAAAGMNQYGPQFLGVSSPRQGNSGTVQ
ncbi:MAG: hypothetical protein ACRC7C_19920 [Beijerinckiaceae bacterium]